VPDWIANVGLPDWWPGWQFVCLTAIPAVVLAVLSMKGSKAWQILLAVLCTLSILGVGYVQGVDDGEVARSTLASSNKAVAELAEQRKAMTKSLDSATQIATTLEHANSTVIKIAKEAAREEMDRIEWETKAAQHESSLESTRQLFPSLLFYLEQTITYPVDLSPEMLGRLDPEGLKNAKHVLSLMETAETALKDENAAQRGLTPDSSFNDSIVEQRALISEWEKEPSTHHEIYRARTRRTVAAAIVLQRCLLTLIAEAEVVRLEERAKEAKHRFDALNSIESKR
jgi:hypothetical protein